jgi:hypothetical protein
MREKPLLTFFIIVILSASFLLPAITSKISLAEMQNIYTDEDLKKYERSDSNTSDTIEVPKINKDKSVTNSLPNDDLSLLVSKYGKPDIDDSTQYDNPRPPIVTRWLIYKKENVRAWYVPDGVSIGDPPPYRKWKLFGFADEKTKKPISAYEADRRLKQRLKKP